MKKYLHYLLLIILAVIILAPFLYALVVSFESAEETLAFPPVLLPAHLATDSYSKALATAPLISFIVNSFVVSLLVHRRTDYNMQFSCIRVCFSEISLQKDLIYSLFVYHDDSC